MAKYSRDIEIGITPEIADQTPRCRAVNVQCADDTWTAMILLFDSEYHELAGVDREMIEWCDHSHRTAATAEKCRLKLVKRADEMSQELAADQ
jgi:hypothetical protein